MTFFAVENLISQNSIALTCNPACGPGVGKGGVGSSESSYQSPSDHGCFTELTCQPVSDRKGTGRSPVPNVGHIQFPAIISHCLLQLRT
jgi:hypothetical protein